MPGGVGVALDTQCPTAHYRPPMTNDTQDTKPDAAPSPSSAAASPATSPTPADSPPRVRLNITLTRATHQRIKVWCAARGVTMQNALEGMLDKAFAKVEPK